MKRAFLPRRGSEQFLGQQASRRPAAELCYSTLTSPELASCLSSIFRLPPSEDMVGSSWSSSSSCTSSFGSLDDDDVISVVKMRDARAVPPEGSVKFLCSYGGRILPRHIDGALRYVGGNNRVVSVDRSSLHYYELQRKLREMCGWDDDVSLRCQLPSEDLDALVSVTSDDDLANLLEEYDAASKDRLQPLKIRAFLFPRTPALSPNFRFHRQNGSPATSARMPSPVTCAPRWSAAPQAARPAQSRYLVHNGRHGQ